MAATLRCDTIQNASSSTANLTLDASGNATVGNTLAMGSSFKRNRIINGDMRVDQRATAATTDGAYSVDRWTIARGNDATESFAQNSDAPTGFSYSLRNTVSVGDGTIGATQYSGFQQKIEGYNIADLAFGTANAKSVTLSFWVRSTVTGQYTGNIRNNGDSRICPFNFTVNTTNTWEYKTQTFSGCTDGTWNSTNGVGMWVTVYGALGSTYAAGTAGTWNSTSQYGSGTPVNGIASNGNIIAITGVQLEVGSVATPYERQIYSEQLAQCQRYYQQIDSLGWVNLLTGTYNGVWVAWKVSMRASPTVTLYSTNTSTAGKIYYQDGATDVNASASPVTLDGTQVRVNNVSTNVGSNMYCKVTASIEL